MKKKAKKKNNKKLVIGILIILILLAVVAGFLYFKGGITGNAIEPYCPPIPAGSLPYTCSESNWNYTLEPIIRPASGIQNKTWINLTRCDRGVIHPPSELVSNYCQKSDWNYTLYPAVCPIFEKQYRVWEKTYNCTNGVFYENELVNCIYSGSDESPCNSSLDFYSYGLMAYYPLDDPRNLGRDYLGNYNGSNQHTNLSFEGIKMGSGYFDGNSRILINLPSLNWEDYTFSIWVKLNDSSSFRNWLVQGPYYLWSYTKGKCSFTTPLEMGINQNNIFAFSWERGVNNLNFVKRADAILDKDWHQVVITQNGLKRRLYVDGVFIGTGSVPQNVLPPYANMPLLLGGGEYARKETYDVPQSLGWKGNIDEFRVFNRSLTSEEVISLYNFENVPENCSYPPNTNDDSSETPVGKIYISNCQDLQNIKNNLNISYYLINDIDCSSTKNWNAGQGFSPIGNDYFNKFLGTLDGRRYKIYNLTINRPDLAYVGLFGNNGGNISNIILENVGIIGSIYVGSLSGMSSGYISNSSSTGKVFGSTKLGGLIGDQDGGIIQESFSSVEVIEDPNYFDNIGGNTGSIGGLVGFQEKGQILNSYSTGKIKGHRPFIGGLVGFQSPLGNTKILNSYSTGAIVTSTTGVGGLVGFSWSLISDSFATGVPSGFSPIGGLVGESNKIINNSYFIKGPFGCVGKFSGSLSDCFNVNVKSFFYNKSNLPLNNWDFENIWVEVDNNYPILKWQLEQDHTLEICGNEVDEDGDGVLDNGCSGSCDTDNDSYGQSLLLWCSLTMPLGDCDDNNANINPNMTEICDDLIDNDCNGDVDAEDEACYVATIDNETLPPIIFENVTTNITEEVESTATNVVYSGNSVIVNENVLNKSSGLNVSKPLVDFIYFNKTQRPNLLLDSDYSVEKGNALNKSYIIITHNFSQQPYDMKFIYYTPNNGETGVCIRDEEIKNINEVFANCTYIACPGEKENYFCFVEDGRFKITGLKHSAIIGTGNVTCGDLICTDEENCTSCSADCGSCSVVGTTSTPGSTTTATPSSWGGSSSSTTTSTPSSNTDEEEVLDIQTTEEVKDSQNLEGSSPDSNILGKVTIGLIVFVIILILIFVIIIVQTYRKKKLQEQIFLDSQNTDSNNFNPSFN